MDARRMDVKKAVFDQFCQAAPIAVLAQLLIRRFVSEKFDELFEVNRGTQYEGKISFSALGAAVADVALGLCENPSQAYRKHKAELKAARCSFYEKLNGTGTKLSESVVAASAERAVELQDELAFEQWECLPGYRVFAVDGNHLQKTEKRLEVLRQSPDAPLPGTIVARFDLGRQIFDQVYLLEDAHSQESTTLGRVAEDLGQRDVVVADRNFCIVSFLAQLDEQESCFAIRQHGRIPGVLQGQQSQGKRTRTGMVREQAMRVSKTQGAHVVRRISIKLDKPTRDGCSEIHILSNLPRSVTAAQIANLYLRRWEEETAFYHLRMCFNGELPAIGHPRAALFLFCITTMAYNIFQALLSVLYAEHDEDEVNQLSYFYVSLDIARHTPGMLTILHDEDWERLIPQKAKAFTQLLRRVARNVDLREYRKGVNAERSRRKKKKSNRRGRHVATARLLAENAR